MRCSAMVKRADQLGHTEPEHYLWCASQHHKLDPTKPASKWDTAWRALRDAAGLPGLRFHDLRHTVVTRLLEAGEPDHVVESITGHLSRRMLEHYSHIRLKAKKDALDRLDSPVALACSRHGETGLGRERACLVVLEVVEQHTPIVVQVREHGRCLYLDSADTSQARISLDSQGRR